MTNKYSLKNCESIVFVVVLLHTNTAHTHTHTHTPTHTHNHTCRNTHILTNTISMVPEDSKCNSGLPAGPCFVQKTIFLPTSNRLDCQKELMAIDQYQKPLHQQPPPMYNKRKRERETEREREREKQKQREREKEGGEQLINS